MSKSIQETAPEIQRESQALERYLESLQHERCPHRPRHMTPEQVRMYQVAALFRAALPDATRPAPEFVARLQEQAAAAFGNRRCWDKE